MAMCQVYKDMSIIHIVIFIIACLVIYVIICSHDHGKQKALNDVYDYDYIYD